MQSFACRGSALVPVLGLVRANLTPGLSPCSPGEPDLYFCAALAALSLITLPKLRSLRAGVAGEGGVLGWVCPLQALGIKLDMSVWVLPGSATSPAWPLTPDWSCCACLSGIASALTEMGCLPFPQVHLPNRPGLPDGSVSLPSSESPFSESAWPDFFRSFRRLAHQYSRAAVKREG